MYLFKMSCASGCRCGFRSWSGAVAEDPAPESIYCSSNAQPWVGSIVGSQVHGLAPTCPPAQPGASTAAVVFPPAPMFPECASI